MIHNNKVLILSPHTDDAELGCGGTISKLVQEGKEILWIVFSTCNESLPHTMAPFTLAMEFTHVAESLGLSKENYRILNYPVRKLEENRQSILEDLIRFRKEFCPDLVIGPSVNDYHQDHTVVAHEMIRAFKTSSSIICYELPWNHVQFHTQHFIKLSDNNVSKKIKLLKFYKSQMLIKRHYFQPEFIRGLATTRGAQVSHQYAEAFEVVRWISD